MSLKDKELDSSRDEIKGLKDLVSNVEVKNEKVRKEAMI
jgi:hypothetical protein